MNRATVAGVLVSITQRPGMCAEQLFGGGIRMYRQFLTKNTMLLLVGTFAALVLSGCNEDKIERSLGKQTAAAVEKEYVIETDPLLSEWVNNMGQTLVAHSHRQHIPYSFQVIDTDMVNAFAAPGGFIFVSRGMIRLCRTEDDLAAVLAHEVGHVQCMHGLKAIKSSRLTSALTILAAEGAKTFGGKDLAELTEAFEGSISDITSTMMNSGYARSAEREADRAALTIMKRVGYDPNGLVSMLKEMKKDLKPGGLDFAKTHPDPDDRIRDIEKEIGRYQPVQSPAPRQERFVRNLKGV